MAAVSLKRSIRDSYATRDEVANQLSPKPARRFLVMWSWNEELKPELVVWTWPKSLFKNINGWSNIKYRKLFPSFARTFARPWHGGSV